MARKGDYSNPNKYSDKKSFDGSPMEPGKVLVPFVKDFADLPKKLCVDDNFITQHFGGFPVTVGFMQVDKDKFEKNMKAFWSDVNEYLSEMRAGRCVIGYDDCGEKILCPNTRRCTGCPEKGLHERSKPNIIEITTLDQDYEGEGFEGIPDESQPSVEDQAIENVEPSPTEDKHYEILIARLKRTIPDSRKSSVSARHPCRWMILLRQ